MKELHLRFHKWYDTLPEPKRFLTMLCVMLPGFLLVFTNDSYVLNGLGLIYFLIMLFLRWAYVAWRDEDEQE